MLGTAPHTLFISDLHLSAARPVTTRLLLDFLEHSAPGAQALYVLGDLFEYWAGDDDLDDPLHQEVCDAFSALAASGTQLFFMHGNRDFLIAERFAQTAGATLLPDPCLIDLHGQQALLTHGDILCTDDIAYQDFRRQVRDPAWQRTFLNTPLPVRKAQIEALRQRSESEKSYKSQAIMDVNPDAVKDLLQQYDYPPLLIHGHTHRPGTHTVENQGHISTRWVLSDWHDSGDCLCCNSSGCVRYPVPLPADTTA